MSEHLKPCPFCGGKAKLIELEDWFRGVAYVRCDDCSAEIDCSGTASEAGKAWNRRAPDAALSAEVERLKSGNGDELAERAKAALAAAHQACFKHPDRGPVGMSHGPFSGVNEALGIIAQIRASWGTTNRLLTELQKAVFGGEPDPTLRAGNFVEMARSLHAACDGGRARAEAAEARVAALEGALRRAQTWMLETPPPGTPGCTVECVAIDAALLGENAEKHISEWRQGRTALSHTKEQA